MAVAQLQILNKILENKDYSIVTLNNLNDDYFPLYKDEFNYIKNHYNVYKSIPDQLTFLEVFPKFDVVKVNEPDSYLLEQLYKDYNRKYLASKLNELAPLITNKDTTDKAVEMFLKSVEGLHQGSAMTSIDILRDYKERYDAYEERTKDFSKFYITTGFKELDQVIGGWDRQEEYALIVARTNTGKSFVALKMAAAAAEQGMTVGLYSGEMTARKVGYRIDTILGHVSNGSLIHGNINIQDDYAKYLNNISKNVKGSIKVITPNDIAGPADIPALRAFIEREHLDILFIDQISLLEDARHGKSPIEKTANISKDIKNLQVMKKIPIIAVCQQNRSTTEDGVQNTTQIAQSDRLGQDATCVVFLEKKDDNMKFTLVKSRDSENGAVLNYIVDLNKGYWTYVVSENEKINSSEEIEELENRYSDNYTESEENIEWGEL